ncbi:hypothetical protein B1M_38536, partial [Burkholderia sp. TJI49]
MPPAYLTSAPSVVVTGASSPPPVFDSAPPVLPP